MFPPPTSVPLCWGCLGTKLGSNTGGGARGPPRTQRGFRGSPLGSTFEVKCLAIGPDGVGDTVGRGSPAPTCRRGKLQGGLRVAVLAAVHGRALHVGTGIQQQLLGHREDTGVVGSMG